MHQKGYCSLFANNLKNIKQIINSPMNALWKNLEKSSNLICECIKIIKGMKTVVQ